MVGLIALETAFAEEAPEMVTLLTDCKYCPLAYVNNMEGLAPSVSIVPALIILGCLDVVT